ncbi:MAG: glycosyltransferase family 2 protein [Patescibacteria group bacterium]|nr:glycosyltransferase family 2 protein [Patescibacteria group bacterium]
MKIAAIIPAYNEEKSISPIIRVARENALINEVIVVDDGSSDATTEVARGDGANVVRIEENQGKGNALEVGIQETDADILLFLDADLVGLRSQHLTMLLEPVIEEVADMTVGAIDRKMFRTFLNEWFRKTESPFSGMRVIKSSFWREIPKKYKKKFYIESVITYLAKKNNLKVMPFVLEGVRHITKERKMGFWEGSKARWKMNWQIILINLALRLKPKNSLKIHSR